MADRNEICAPGEWPSPIGAPEAVGAARAIAEVEVDHGAAWLGEGRPDEGGRTQIVRLRPDGAAEDVLPEGLSARSRVHEYGGGAILADKGTVYFVNQQDQRIWRDRPGGKPEPLSAEGAWRFADMAIDHERGRLIAVREDWSGAGEPANDLATIDLATGAVATLWRGSDFVSDPRLSPDGARLAWIAWSHPAMPWDATTLHVARLGADGGLADMTVVASAEEGFAIIQPQWAADGALYFVSDRPGDWSLHRWRGGAAEPVVALGGDLGGPPWQFRFSDYALLSPRRALAIRTMGGVDTLMAIDLDAGTAAPVGTPFTSMRGLRAEGRSAVMLGASPQAGFALYRVGAGGVEAELYRPRGAGLPGGFASEPQAISYPTSDGATAHAFYYPPRHPDFRAEVPPPMIVTAHGGPTSVSKPVLAMWRTYWTSRGFAILDVNYRGSSGYGRAYRKALDGAWGEADIADVVCGARHCVETGLADGKRMAIYGGSAGGYVVLAALAFHPGVFAAGVSLYGISDLEALAADTHKFEAHYTDTLIGPLPEARAIYRARSPIHAADRIAAPLLLFQGLEDKAVPPSQSEAIHAAVKANGAATAYIAYAGEGHGFRKAENQIRTLTATRAFLAAVFGLSPREPLEPIEIDNAPAQA